MNSENIAEILELLKLYYGDSRGAGHTKLMIDGLKNYNKLAILITNNLNYGKRLIMENLLDNIIIIPFSQIPSYAIGLRLFFSKKIPIIFDNSAMIEMLFEIDKFKSYHRLREIELENDYLQTRMKDFVEKTDIQKKINKALKDENGKLYDENSKLRYDIEELKETLHYKRHPWRLLKRFLKRG
jgi:hypothetical protein